MIQRELDDFKDTGLFPLEEERQNLHGLIEENGQKPLCENDELMMQSQRLDEIIVRIQKEPKV